VFSLVDYDERVTARDYDIAFGVIRIKFKSICVRKSILMLYSCTED